MKKAILAATVLFSMTTFAVNPKSINPVKEKLEIGKIVFKKANILKAAIGWTITCYSGNNHYTEITTNTFAEAVSFANNFCGSENWLIGGNN
jgi:hypothetical protein